MHAEHARFNKTIVRSIRYKAFGVAIQAYGALPVLKVINRIPTGIDHALLHTLAPDLKCVVSHASLISGRDDVVGGAYGPRADGAV